MDPVLTHRVFDVIARTQKIARDDITVDKTLEELGIDSFDGINLLFALEDEFNIVLPYDLPKLHSIQHILIALEPFLDVSPAA